MLREYWTYGDMFYSGLQPTEQSYFQIWEKVFALAVCTSSAGLDNVLMIASQLFMAGDACRSVTRFKKTGKHLDVFCSVHLL